MSEPTPEASAPADPFGQFMHHSLITHEIYQSYINAGFTEAQAYGLVQIHLAAFLRQA